MSARPIGVGNQTYNGDLREVADGIAVGLVGAGHAHGADAMHSARGLVIARIRVPQAVAWETRRYHADERDETERWSGVDSSEKGILRTNAKMKEQENEGNALVAHAVMNEGQRSTHRCPLSMLMTIPIKQEHVLNSLGHYQLILAGMRQRYHAVRRRFR